MICQYAYPTWYAYLRVYSSRAAVHTVILSSKARLDFGWLIWITLFCFVGLFGRFGCFHLSVKSKWKLAVLLCYRDIGWYLNACNSEWRLTLARTKLCTQFLFHGSTEWLWLEGVSGGQLVPCPWSSKVTYSSVILLYTEHFSSFL